VAGLRNQVATRTITSDDGVSDELYRYDTYMTAAVSGSTARLTKVVLVCYHVLVSTKPRNACTEARPLWDSASAGHPEP